MVSVQDLHVTGCCKGSVGGTEADKCRKGGWDQRMERRGAVFLPQPMGQRTCLENGECN